MFKYFKYVLLALILYISAAVLRTESMYLLMIPMYILIIYDTVKEEVYMGKMSKFRLEGEVESSSRLKEFVLVLLIVIFSVVVNVVLFKESSYVTLEPTSNTVNFLTYALLIAPIMEEYIFRYFIFNNIARDTNVNTAIICSSILFTIYHWNGEHILIYLCMGLLFASLRNVTSIFATISMHILFNLYNVMFSYNVSKFLHNNILTYFVCLLFVLNFMFVMGSYLFKNRKSLQYLFKESILGVFTLIVFVIIILLELSAKFFI